MASTRLSLRTRIQGDVKLTGAIRDQVNQDLHAGEGDLRVILLEKIDLNPHNPRRLSVNQEDVIALREQAIAQSGELREELRGTKFFLAIDKNISEISDEVRRKQLENIYLLAKSIARRGLIQPISVFGNDGRYIIMAGERRYLAHLLIGRASIRALTRERLDDEIEERAGSLIENIARENLTTIEKIDFIEELSVLFQQKTGKPMTAEDMHELIHESIRSCKRYLRFIQSPPDIRNAIRDGTLASVRDIEKVLQIESEDDEPQEPVTEDVEPASKVARPGRPKTSISLGKVKNTHVIQSIISSWASAHGIDLQLKVDDWSDVNQAQEAWTSFIDEVNQAIEEGHHGK